MGSAAGPLRALLLGALVFSMLVALLSASIGGARVLGGVLRGWQSLREAMVGLGIGLAGSETSQCSAQWLLPRDAPMSGIAISDVLQLGREIFGSITSGLSLGLLLV